MLNLVAISIIIPAFNEAGELVNTLEHLRTAQRHFHEQYGLDFEGDGIQQSTPDLLALAAPLFKQFTQQLYPGDVFTVIFRVQCL